MKSVLVIASGFPPQGGGGVTRVHSFVKYLPEFGWQPIVLTLEEEYALSHALDPTLLREYGQLVEIYRTKSLEPTRFFGIDFRHQMADENGGSLPLSGLARRVAKLLYQQIMIPDEKMLWLPFALRKGTQLIRDRDVEVVFASTPPHSVSLIGCILKRTNGIRFIWDIRDDWVGNPYFASRFWHRRRAEEFLESIVVNDADRIVVVSEASSALLQQKYPHLRPRIDLIPNGFDRDSYPTVDDRQSGKAKCRIIHTGSLTRRRSVPALWRAISELRDSGYVTADNFEMTLVGSVHRNVLDIIKGLDLGEIVNRIGHVSHKQSLEYMLMASACLLISTDEEGAQTAIPSKFYEYIGAGRFVLALASSDSATAHLMRQSQVGTVVAPEDTSAIKDAVLRIVRRHQDGLLNLDTADDWIGQFDRRALTGRLADVFDSI